MFGYIYKTTNLINNKIYIGQKKSTEFISSYYGSGKLLVKALRKYGKENFKVEVICWCESKQKLDEEERYWIKNLNSTDNLIGYNLAEGGEGSNGGGFKGKCHSEESRRKISAACKKDNDDRKKSGWISPARGNKRIEKDSKVKFVPVEFISYYIEQGWVLHTSKKDLDLNVEKGPKRNWDPIKLKERNDKISKTVSERLRGHSVSEDTKKKLSEKNKGQVPSNKGKKRIWKDNKYKYVLEDEIVYYIEQGWIKK